MTMEVNPVYLKIKELAAKQKISMAQLERNLGFSSGVLSNWRRSSPSADKLAEVASYFHVSVDYLLGRKNVLSKSEAYLIQMFREETKGMSEKDRTIFAHKVSQIFKLIKLLSADSTPDFDVSFEDKETNDDQK